MSPLTFLSHSNKYYGNNYNRLEQFLVRLVANVWVLSGFDPKNNQTHGLVNSMSHHVPPTHLGDFEHPLQMDVGSRRQALENHEPQRLKHPDKSFEGGKHKCLKLDETNRLCREINILETT